MAETWDTVQVFDQLQLYGKEVTCEDSVPKPKVLWADDAKHYVGPKPSTAGLQKQVQNECSKI